MKLLYAYDPKEDAFAILSHNLSDADAQEQLKEIRKEKVPVYALNQPRAHNTIDPDHCPSCAKLVLRMLKQETDPLNPTSSVALQIIRIPNVVRGTRSHRINKQKERSVRCQSI